VITSPSNKRVVKAVRLKKRALREKERRFLVEGAQGVAEAVASGVPVHEVFHAPGTAERLDPVLERARAAGITVHAVSDEVMARLTSTVTPQGIVAVADFVDVPIDRLPAEPSSVAVLVEVRDPGNAGTILRSADAAGTDAVVFTPASVDVYNEKAVRATAGSLFHVPVVREAPLADAMEALRSRGLAVVAASARGDTSIYETDLSRPTAVLFGNEAHGLPPEVEAAADGTVRVPISGRAESLNLAAASALILFEIARQRAGESSLAGLVAGAAHDIRSPLASMLAFTSTILSRWDRLDDEQKRAMVSSMAFDAGRMRALVAQLVDAARLSSGRLELSLEPVDLLATARTVAEQATHPDLPPIEVSGNPATVTADGARVATMLRALTDAAAWWGQEGPVMVTVRSSDGSATVEVARRGGELDHETARDIFGPREPGTGGGSKVGLHVAKGLADAHGATLSAEAVDGIRFTLAFPAT
jgi:RNA methyltransferase, TrmH family